MAASREIDKIPSGQPSKRESISWRLVLAAFFWTRRTVEVTSLRVRNATNPQPNMTVGLLNMNFIARAILPVLFASVSFAAMANDADFTLRNKTGYQIDEVYVGPHSSDHWGRDVMGSDALDDGEKVKITFPHGNGACHFDLKVVYNDKDTAEWMDINLCETDVITLRWNKKTGETTASFD